MLNLVLIGLNHRTADVGTRERVAFEESSLPDALRKLSAHPGIQEALILSTCNRVEFISRVANREEGVACLEEFLAQRSQLPRERLSAALYRYHDADAVRHLFRVASSLDSMILGEPQILGQVKSAYGLAAEAHAVGTYLNTMLQAAFRVAKRIRSETNIGEYSVSASSAAVELARKVLGDLSDKSILVVGAGKMGETAVRHLVSSGAGSIRVTNRSPEAAAALAALFHGTSVEFGDLPHWVASADIVIVSTGASTPVITRAMAESFMRDRKHAPIVMVDLSVPRNIDPAVGAMDNVFCYDIDDLGAVVEASLHERKKAAQLAEKIVEQEVETLCFRLKSLDVTPLVVQLQNRIDEICRGELMRFLRKSGPKDPKDVEELESMVSRISGKIAHPLITHLRSDSQDPAHREASVSTIRRIFGILPPDSD
jgi:glutamyl-tRNA reductase